MRALTAALFIGIASPAIAYAADRQEGPLRELPTDRPDKTEGPFTVDAGHVQIEFDLVAFTRDRHADVRTETFTVAPVNVKLGLTNDTDVELILGGYIRQTVTDGTARNRTQGVGDVTLRMKHNLWGDDGGKTALALLPFVTLPTAGSGLGVEAVEFGLIVPLAVEAAPGITVGAMTEVDLTREDGGAYRPRFINSASVAFDLTDRLGVYTELFTERSVANGSPWIVTGDTGLAYKLSPDMQIDTGINFGLTDAADDLTVFAGLSRRF